MPDSILKRIVAGAFRPGPVPAAGNDSLNLKGSRVIGTGNLTSATGLITGRYAFRVRCSGVTIGHNGRIHAIWNICYLCSWFEPWIYTVTCKTAVLRRNRTWIRDHGLGKGRSSTGRTIYADVCWPPGPGPAAVTICPVKRKTRTEISESMVLFSPVLTRNLVGWHHVNDVMIWNVGMCYTYYIT